MKKKNVTDNPQDYIQLLEQKIEELTSKNVLLEKEVECYKDILNEIDDGIFIKNETDQYVYLNKAFSKILDKPTEAIINKKDKEIFEDKISNELSKLIFSKEETNQIVCTFNYQIKETVQQLEWRCFPLQKINIGEFRTFGKVKVIGNSDIIESFIAASDAALSAENFADAARILHGYAKNTIGAKSGYIALLSSDGAENEVVYLDAGGLPCTVNPELPMPIRGLRAEAYKNKKPAYCNNFEESPWKKFMPQGHVMLQNVLFAPINSGNETVGLLGLANKPGGFTENDAKIAQYFANLAASVLINATNNDKLQQQYRQYLTLVENIPGIVYRCNLHHPRTMIFINSEASFITGYEIQDFISGAINWLDIIHPDDLQNYENKIKHAAESRESYEIVYRIIHKNGNIRWLHDKGRLVNGDNLHNACLDGVTIDVTQLYETQQKYELAEQRYKSFFENTGTAMAAFNSDSIIESCNQKFVELCECSKEEIIGLMHWYDFVHELDKERMFSYHKQRQQADNNAPKQYHFRFVTKIGNIREIYLNIVTLHETGERLASLTDVTEMVKLQKEIKKQWQFSKTLLDTIPLPVFYKDKEGRYLGCNQAFEDIMGVTSEDIIGKTVYDLTPADIAYLYAQKDNELYANPGFQKYEWVLRNKKGEIREVIYYKASYFDDENKNAGIVGTMLDVTERNKNIEQLKQSEERFRLFYEQAPIAYQSLDTEGCLLDVNEVWLQTLGYQRDEIIGKWFGDFLVASYKPLFTERFEQFKKTGQTSSVDFELLKKDGASVFGVFNGKVSYDANGEMIRSHCVFYDLSERHKAELVLKESELQLQTIFDATPSVMCLLNDKLEIIRINNTGLQFAGNNFNDIIYKQGGDVFGCIYALKNPEGCGKGDECKLCAVRNTVLQALHEQKNVSRVETTMWVIGKDGQQQLYYFLQSVNILNFSGWKGILVTLDNITERKQMEMALQQSEQRYQKITETITDYIYNVKIENNIAVSTTHSPTCYGVTGYSRQEFENNPHLWYNIIFEDDKVLVEQQLHKLFAFKTSVTVEHRIYKKNGDLRWIANTVIPNIDKNGILISYDGIIRDITERKMAELQLVESHQYIESIFKAAPIAIGVVKERVFFKVNAQMCQMLGYTEDELLGQSAIIIYTTAEEFNNAGSEKYRQIKEKGTGTVETLWKCKDGTIIDVILSSTPIDNNDWSKGVTFTAVDITQRKKTEINLLNSEMKFKKFFEDDLTADYLMKPDGTLIDCNPAFIELFGFKDKSDLIGKSIIIFYPEPHLFNETIQILKQQKKLTGQEIVLRNNYNNLITVIENKICTISDNHEILEIRGYIYDVTNRKVAENALRQSEEKFRNIVETMNEGLLMVDNNDVVLFANTRLCNMFGFQQEELLGKLGLETIIYEEDRHIIIERNKKRLEKISDSYHIRGITKSGKIIWLSISGSPVTDDTGVVIGSIGLITDITDAKLAEIALIKSEQRYRTIVDTANEGIWTMDENYITSYVNNRMAAMLGYDVSEMLGRPFTDFMIKAELQDNTKKMQNRAKGISEIYERSFIRKDGNIRNFIVSANSLIDEDEKFRGSFAMLTDISDLRRIEKELLEKNLQIEAFFNYSLDLLCIANIEGYFIRLNPEWEKTLGYSLQDLEGHRFFDFVHPDDIQATLDAVKDLENQKLLLNFINRYRCKDGTYRWIEWRSKPIGDIIYSAARDITEQRELQIALMESEHKIKNKLQSLLSPEGDIGNLELSDIIDTKALQNIMDNFYAITKVGIGIIDLNGKVLVATGWQDLCTKFHRVHPETCRNCMESDVLLSSGVNEGEYKMYKCKNNIWDLAMPINIGGKHVGNIFLGQFLFEEEQIDFELFRAQAKKYGFDEAQYIEALTKLPRWSRETVDNVMQFYIQFANVISTLSFSNLKLARIVEQLTQTQAALAESEKLNRDLIEQMTDGVYQSTPEGKFLMVNQAMVNMFGYNTAEEMLGIDIPKDLYPSPLDRTDIYPESGFDEMKVYQLKKKDGTLIWVEENGWYIKDEDGKIIWHEGVMRDVTKRVEADLEIEKYNNLLNSVRKAQAMYIGQQDTKPIFNSLLETLINITDSEFGFLDEVLYEADGTPYKINLALSNISWDKSSEKLYDELTNREFEFRDLGNLAGLPVMTQKPVISNNVNTDPRSKGIPCGHPVINTFMGLPVWSEGKIIAVLGIANNKNGYTEHLADFLEPYINTCAEIIRAIRLKNNETQMLVALKESEEVFRKLYEDSYDPILLMTETTFVNCNNATVQILDAENKEQILGLTPMDISPQYQPDGRTSIEAAHYFIDNALQNGYTRFEWLCKKFNDEPIYFEITLMPIILRSESLIHITWRDITARKAAELKLRDSEERFRSLVNSLSDVIYTLDLEQRHTGVFGSWVEKAGLTPEFFLGKSASEIYDNEFAEIHVQANNKALSGEVVTYEWSIADAQKMNYYQTIVAPMYDADGKIYGIVGAGRNITDRVNAESELKLKSFMLDQISDMVTITDLQGKITYVNQAELDASGFTKEDIIGKSVATYGEDASRGATQNEIIENTLKNGSWRGEVVNYFPNGQEYILDCRTTVIVDEKNNPIALCGISTDITRKKQIELEIIKAKEKAELSEFKIRNMFNNSLTGFIYFDTNGNILDANKAVLDIFGSPSLQASQQHVNLLTFKNLVDVGFADDVRKSIEKKQSVTNSTLYISRWNKQSYIQYQIIPIVINEEIVGLWANFNDLTQIYQLQETVKIEKDRLQGILEGTNAGTWEWNILTGETIFNERWAEIIGYTLNEISPVSIDTWAKYCHPDDLKISNALIEKHLKGESDYYSCEVRMAHKNGSWVWVLDHGKVVSYTAEGKPLLMMGTHLDITERKIAEVGLRENESRLSLAMKVAKMGYWKFDCGSFNVEWSKGHEELFGIPYHEFAGTLDAVQQMVHPDDRAHGEINLKNAIELKIPFENTYRVVKPDGNISWIFSYGVHYENVEGKTEYIFGISQDITERVLAQDKLNMEAMRRSKLMEQSKDGIVILNEEGKVVESNKRFAKMLGYSLEEMNDLTVMDWEAVFSSERLNKMLRSIDEAGDNFETQHRRKDGSIYDVEITSNASWFGGYKLIFCVCRDITERKNQQIAKEQQLLFKTALNDISDVIISKDNQEDILENVNQIIGATLGVDRILIYDVSFEYNRIEALCEWLSKPSDKVAKTKGSYTSLDMFGKAFNQIKETEKYLESYFNEINPLFHEKDADVLLHQHLHIQSLLWYPFAFYNFGYYLFTINQIESHRKWQKEELDFLETISKQVSFALLKINFLNEQHQSRIILEENEKKYRLLFENMAEGVFYQAADGQIIDANKSACKIFGIPLSELLNRTSHHPEWKVVDKDGNMLLPEQHPSIIALQSGKPLINYEVGLYNPETRNTVWLITNAIPQFKAGSDRAHLVFVTMQDISDRRNFEIELLLAKEKAEENEEQIKIQNQEILFNYERLESLLKVSQFQTNSIQELLDFALSQAVALTKSKIGYIYFYEEDKKQFILNTWSKEVMKECTVINPQTIYELEKTGCWGEAVRQRKPIVINDYQAKNPLKKGIPEGHVKLEKFLTIPVIVDNKIVAVAGVANKITDYDDTDIRQLILLMDNVWKISERVTLIKNLQLAKEKAEESEEKFRSIAEQLNDMIALTDEMGIITYASPASVAIFGLAPEEMVGKKFTDFLDESSIPKAMEAFRNDIAKHSSTLGLELVMKKQDGTLFFGELNGASFKAGSIHGALVTIRDISERKRAEIELIQSEAKFRSTFDQSPVGSVIVGLDKHFVRCNATFCKYLGYEENELIGKSISDITHPDDLEIGINELKQLVEGKLEFFSGQKRYLRKDGGVLWGDITIRLIKDAEKKPLYFLPIIQDITDRKHAEEALRESEERFKSLHNASFGGIAIHDKGIILECNQELADMTGYTVEELTRGMDGLLLIAEKSRADVMSKIKSGYEKPYEAIGLRKNGTEYPLRLEARNVRYKGKLVRTVEFRDITEIKQAEQRAMERQLFVERIAEQSPNFIYVFDIYTKSNIFINKDLRAYLGYQPNQAPGDSYQLIEAVIHPDDMEQFNDYGALVEKWDLEYVKSFEYRLKDAAGNWRYFIGKEKEFQRKDGKIVSLIGVVSDVTEQKKSEIEIKISEYKYRMLFENMLNGFVLLQLLYNENGMPCDLLLTEANAAFEKMTGIPAEKVVGKKVSELPHFVQKDTEVKEYYAIAQKGGNLKITRREESWNKVFEIYAFSPEKGKLALVVADVTERDKQITEIVSLNEELLSVNEEFQAQNEELQQTNVRLDEQQGKLQQVFEEIKISEEQYRTLFENMLNGFALHEIILNKKGKPVDYRFLQVNPAFEKLTGFNSSNILFRTVKEVMPGTEDYWIDTYGKVALTGKHIRYENYSKELNRYYEVVAYCPKKMQFAVIISDITERKQLELVEETRKEEIHQLALLAEQLIKVQDLDEFYNLIGKTIQNIIGKGYIVITQYQPDDDNMCIKKFYGIGKKLETLAKILGINPIGFTIPLSDSVRYLLHNYHAHFYKYEGGIRELFNGVLNESLAAPVTKAFDIKDVYGISLMQKNFILGSITIFTTSATNSLKLELLESLILQASNAMQRIMYGEDIKEKEQQFRSIFNNSVDAIFILDADGYVLEANNIACSRTEYPKKELLGLNRMQFNHPDYLHVFSDAIKVMKKQAVASYETIHITKSGKNIPVEVFANQIEYKGKKCYMLVARDITERKEIEKRVFNAVIEAEEKERLRFSKDLHDGIGALLSSIKIYINLLETGAEEHKRLLLIESTKELIGEAILAAREISRNLQPSTIRDFGLVSSVQTFIDKINKTGVLKINSRYMHLEARLPINAEVMLYRIITELFNNTLKHANANGVTLLLSKENNLIKLLYVDDGIGFDAEKVKHGLGLDNIRARVLSIEGVFKMETEKGMGIKVSIIIDLRKFIAT